jgi:hypothetical protein
MHRATVFLLLSATLCACSSQLPSDGSTPFEGKGCFVSGFEANSFVQDPPRNTEFWHVSKASDQRFFEQFAELASGRLTKAGRFSVSVRIRGTLSKVGHYGHLSGSPREITVSSFSEMRPYTDDEECYTTHKVALLPPNTSFERTRER